MSSAEAGEAAFAEVAEKLGAPRILVNCAGIAIGMKTIGKDGPHPLDLYRKVIEVNLIGTFNMIRLFAARCQDLEPLEGERARRHRQYRLGRRLSTARSARWPIRRRKAAWSA